MLAIVAAIPPRSLASHASVPFTKRPFNARVSTSAVIAEEINGGEHQRLRQRIGVTRKRGRVNLFIIAMGRLTFGAPVILSQGDPSSLARYADPLPQALVLTAIVISFAMTALVLTLALKGRFVNGTDACDAEDEPVVEGSPR